MILAFSIADLIRVPFGYLMDFLYQFTSNYGMALILFALLVKLILLPASAKSKKSMMRMNLFQPKIKEIQTKYANNPQKMNDEIQMLYAKDMQESRTPQAQMAKALGVPPFALSQLTRRAGRRTMAQLKKQLALCVNADFDIKRGAVREEAALDRLMLALTEK